MEILYCDYCTKSIGADLMVARKELAEIRLVDNGEFRHFYVCENCKKDIIDRLSNARRRYAKENTNDNN